MFMFRIFGKIHPFDNKNTQTHSFVTDNPHHFVTKKPLLKEELAVHNANSYDETLHDALKVPTAFEFVHNKVYMSPEENKELSQSQPFKDARNMAHIHSALFYLSYLPFIKIPVTNFDG